MVMNIEREGEVAQRSGTYLPAVISSSGLLSAPVSWSLWETDDFAACLGAT